MRALVDLQDADCRWPLKSLGSTVDASRRQFFCGAAVAAAGIPYCLCHVRDAYLGTRELSDAEVVSRLRKPSNARGTR